MANANKFVLLGGDDSEDPRQLAAGRQILSPAPVKAPAPTETRFIGLGKLRCIMRRRLGYGGFRIWVRGSMSQVHISSCNSENPGEYELSEVEDGDEYGYGNGGKPYNRRLSRGSYRNYRREYFINWEVLEGGCPDRTYDRHSGTGRGNEYKRDGVGRGNWGNPNDDIAEVTEGSVDEMYTDDEDWSEDEEDQGYHIKKYLVDEPEDMEDMITLEEYEKILEGTRKALETLKAEERRVVLDKDFEDKKLLPSRKNDDDISLKLGFEKEERKAAAEKENITKKISDINFQ